MRLKYSSYNICINIILILCFIYTDLICQEQDSVRTTNIEFITDQLENLAQSTDMTIDYTDLVNDYLYYSHHPININSNEIKLLRDLYLLNEIQLSNLNAYKNQFGLIYTIYELLAISGFNETTVKALEPFVFFGASIKKESFKIKNAIEHGTHSLIFRTNRIVEQKSGYSRSPDSAITHPGSVYLGDPQHYYLRYSFKYRNNIRLGLTMDKDPGEPMFKASLGDSLQKLMGNNVPFIGDFFSAFAYVENIKFVKSLIVGDYHLEFGQGLTLWSGLAFGKSSEGTNIQKFGRGIRPNTSSNENRFFRGAATTLVYKRVSVTPFFSSNRIDGNISFELDNQNYVTSIIESGLHRTINELMDRKTIKIQILGGNISYKHNNYKLGITVVNTKLNLSQKINNEPYKQFRFSGDRLINYGFDFSANYQKYNLFGEISYSSNEGFAGIAGINTFLAEKFFLTVVYHKYGRDYHNFYNNPFAESSAISNEEGIYFGYSALISRLISITGYVDHYSFPWLTYAANAPSIGKDYLIQVNINTSNSTSMYIKYRYKNNQKNYNSYNYTPILITNNRHEMRLFLSYSIPTNITFKNRFDMVMVDNNSSNEYGYLIYQDILYRPVQFPVELSFRYSLFSTESYDSRIYTYENDVLYAFTIPSYFNTGKRWYLMARYKITSNISAWFRLARTSYSNQNTLGTGNELIIGNHKTEVKFQIRISL